MQDRCKYRCFHKPTNKIYEVYSYDKHFIKATESLVVPSIKNFRLEDCELIQCTGLKDRNGNLVYFDDFVKTKWGEVCSIEMQTDERNYGRVIVKNQKDIAHYPSTIKESEVIGNVYNNSELLEV